MNEVLRSALVAAVLAAIAATLFALTPAPASATRTPALGAHARVP